MSQAPLFIHVLSPLHAGTGQGVDVIDLPIAREKATGIPYLPGSSIKGVLRDAFSGRERDAERSAIFGSPQLEHAGAALFSDARLLLLPVRSLRGTFAYVTSPYLLRRASRDLTGCPELPELSEGGCALTDSSVLQLGQQVVLEDLDLEPQPNQSPIANSWANFLGRAFDSSWEAFFQARLCVVHDDVMTFLFTTATEVVARVRLEDDTKTVARGALWYEEALPAESVLLGMVHTTASRSSAASDIPIMQRVMDTAQHPLQFGGKAGVGRGLCQLRWLRPTPEGAAL